MTANPKLETPPKPEMTNAMPPQPEIRNATLNEDEAIDLQEDFVASDADERKNGESPKQVKIICVKNDTNENLDLYKILQQPLDVES